MQVQLDDVVGMVEDAATSIWTISDYAGRPRIGRSCGEWLDRAGATNGRLDHARPC